MRDKRLEKIKKWILLSVISVGLVCMAVNYLKSQKPDEKGGGGIWSFLGAAATRQIQKTYFLLPAYLEEGEEDGNPVRLAQEILLGRMPIYSYAMEYGGQEQTEDGSMAEIIMRQEGTDEDNKNIEESHLDYGKDALHIENSMLEEMQRENRTHTGQEEAPAQQEDVQEPQDTQEPAQEEIAVPEGFLKPEEPSYTYDWSEDWGYNELVSNFYAIDNTTLLKEEYMNLDSLLYSDLSVNQDAEGPQILIYHTHSQEAFADSVLGDKSTTIVGAGEYLAQLLEQEYGFKVLHHTGEYDVEGRDYAYNNSLPALEEILEQNPTIEVVIDLHRDAVREGQKLVMDLEGRPTARFMFFNGMSYLRKKGDISYLENPYIQENLAFSFQAQVAANEYYPGIARKIYLKAYRYNLHLRPRSMLIELGAQTNTVEEIRNACEPLAHIISIVLGG